MKFTEYPIAVPTGGPSREPVGTLKCFRSSRLAEVVDAIWDCDIPDGAAARGLAIKHAPGTSLLMIAQYRVPARACQGSPDLPAKFAAQIQSHSITMCPNGALGLIIVCLRPEAASRIVGTSLGDFANGNIHLASIFRSCEVSICDDMLAQAHTSSERIATVESFLLRHVRPYRDDIACRAVSYLRRNPTLSVSELATKLSVSSRHLARSFNSTLGVGPKQFARLARFEHMVRKHRSGLPWAQVAAACGLTDQPHLIKEFRSLTGELPTEFFARELPMGMPGGANFVVQCTSH